MYVRRMYKVRTDGQTSMPALLGRLGGVDIKNWDLINTTTFVWTPETVKAIWLTDNHIYLAPYIACESEARSGRDKADHSRLL